MPQLYTFSEARFQKLARSRVNDVRVAKMYWLYNGRNAWHSTWINQYNEGCMHSDLADARRSAEKR
jgi:hypothetical protein